MSRSKSIIVDGYKFDSLAEERRYQELMLLFKAGDITHPEVHPRFILFPTFKNKAGKTVRGAHYTADFMYMENGVIIVEDVKTAASRTQAYQLRQRLFQHLYRDLAFREVDA